MLYKTCAGILCPILSCPSVMQKHTCIHQICYGVNADLLCDHATKPDLHHLGCTHSVHDLGAQFGLVACCRHKSRLYGDLGPNLWIIKMRSPLSTIEGEAASYATGVHTLCLTPISTPPCISPPSPPHPSLCQSPSHTTPPLCCTSDCFSLLVTGM